MIFRAGDRRGLYLAVLAVLLAVRLGWVPLREWGEGGADRVRTLEQVVQRKKALAGAAPQIRADLGRSSRALAKVSEAYFPAVEGLQAFQLLLQRRVEDVAARAQVNLNRVDWGVPAQGEVMKASVRLEATLPYAAAARFVSALESGTPQLYVETLKLVRRPQKSEVDLSVEVSAYGLGRAPKEGGR